MSSDEIRLDRLRLIALGRIPRCGACPRFHELKRKLDALPGSGQTPVPAAPSWCSHRVCAPMARRYRAPGRPNAA